MTDVASLRSAVTSRYAAAGLPSWPDPWPDRQPDDEAYSRLTDPDRYRILFRRADAWIAGLAALLPGITVEELPEVAPPFARGRRVSSDRPGTAPLLVLEKDDPLPVLTLALADPDTVLASPPDCGCDACDDGSEALLNAVDEVFVEMLTGPVVVLRAADRSWDALWSSERQQAAGHPDIPGTFRDLMRTCERIAAGERVALPAGTQVSTSQPWL